MFKISLSLWGLCGHQSAYHCASAWNHSSGAISECFQPRTMRQPNVMDVLNSPTLPSQLLSKTWWLLLHFKISQIRHVPIFKLEFNLFACISRSCCLYAGPATQVWCLRVQGRTSALRANISLLNRRYVHALQVCSSLFGSIVKPSFAEV